MSTDYLVASLPPLAFGAPAPISWEKFVETLGGAAFVERLLGSFKELETELRNAAAEARSGSTEHSRPVEGCSLFWKNRVLAAFQEKDVLRREELLDRVWWDAAGELVPPASPLGEGALAAYALRLKIALKRDKISSAAGNAAFDRLTAETRVKF